MLFKILRETRELPWQPNLNKNKPNCTDFSFVQEMITILAYMIGFLGLANSSIIWKILRDPRQLPWQPNLGKKKPKLHKFQIFIKY